jgi:phosphatidylserine decarboxylase
MITEMFQEAKGCKTREGADRRVQRWAENFADTSVTYVIASQRNGKFIPIIFLSEGQVHLFHSAIDAGICVHR